MVTTQDEQDTLPGVFPENSFVFGNVQPIPALDLFSTKVKEMVGDSGLLKGTNDGAEGSKGKVKETS